MLVDEMAADLDFRVRPALEMTKQLEDSVKKTVSTQADRTMRNSTKKTKPYGINISR